MFTTDSDYNMTILQVTSYYILVAFFGVSVICLPCVFLLCLCRNVCVCIYSPEVKFGFLSLLLSTIVLRQGFLLSLELVYEARQADQQAPGIFLPLLLRCWDYRLWHHHWIFFTVSGIKLRSSCLNGRHFDSWAISSLQLPVLWTLFNKHVYFSSYCQCS